MLLSPRQFRSLQTVHAHSLKASRSTFTSPDKKDGSDIIASSQTEDFALPVADVGGIPGLHHLRRTLKLMDKFCRFSLTIVGYAMIYLLRNKIHK